MNIQNIKLDKETYLYGKDTEMKLSFELVSSKETIVKDCKIHYGYNLHCEGKIGKIQEQLIISDSIHLSPQEPKLLEFLIPILMCDTKPDFLEKYIKNYIYLHIDGGILQKIKKEISPNIVLDGDAIGIKDLRTYEDNSQQKYDDTPSSPENMDELSQKMDFLFKKIDAEKDPQNTFIIKSFNGIIGGFLKDLQTNGITGDTINKEIYKNIKSESFVIRIIDFLLQSKIYNFFYRYIFVVPLFVFIDFFSKGVLGRYLFSPLGIDYTTWMSWEGILGVTCIMIIIITISMEKIFAKKLQSAIYQVNFRNTKDIENVLFEKISNRSLSIDDIFKNIQIIKYNYQGVYEFTIDIKLVMIVYLDGDKDPTPYNVWGFTLFNELGKGMFSPQRVKLGENNYEALSNILLKSQKSKIGLTQPGPAWHYEISCKLDSYDLPDLNTKIDIQKNT